MQICTDLVVMYYKISQLGLFVYKWRASNPNQDTSSLRLSYVFFTSFIRLSYVFSLKYYTNLSVGVASSLGESSYPFSFIRNHILKATRFGLLKKSVRDHRFKNPSTCSCFILGLANIFLWIGQHFFMESPS